jgi:hypothetical protein
MRSARPGRKRDGPGMVAGGMRDYTPRGFLVTETENRVVRAAGLEGADLLEILAACGE